MAQDAPEQDSYPFPWMHQLLHNEVLWTSYSLPIFQVEQIHDKVYAAAKHVIKVLQAPADVRATIRAAAIEAEAAASPENKSVHQDLVCILAMFEALSDNDKVRFINEYKKRSAHVLLGLKLIPPVVTYDPWHVPPILP